MPLAGEKKRILLFAYFTYFMDTVNYALIVPILPYLVKELHATNMQEGILFSSYAIFQLISLLIMGPGSDSFGRKPFLLLSLFGSCFGSLFQAMSTGMWSLIIWRSLTGLFAGSLILVQAVLADLVPAEERSAYVSRLDACGTAGFIMGPAIGGILAQVNNHFPLYVAGTASGLGLLVALFFLKESNPLVLKRREAKKNGVAIEEKKVEEKPLKKARVHITGTMILCFCFEFCVRWSVSTFESRYGIYMTDIFDTPSLLYSWFVVIQSVVCCLYQTLVYPKLTATLKLPLPYLAIFGMIIQFYSYLGMTVNNQYVSMLCTIILFLGFNNAAPTSVSILTTTTHPSIQGQVLSYNNLFWQGSMMVAPLILSAIYSVSKKGMFYFSAILPLIAIVIMGYIATWDSVGEIGRKLMYEEEKKGVDIEMKEEKKENVVVEVKNDAVEMKDVESGDMEMKKESTDVEVKAGEVEVKTENGTAMEVKKEEVAVTAPTNSM